MLVDPNRLPHGARVAFAARCARGVLPLFAAAWPDADAERTAAVERAIALAERSASERQPCEGLQEAILGAVMAAGRALVPHHAPPGLVEDDEPSPKNGEAARIACFAAKVAEHAARAAAAPPDASAQHALDAFRFALDAILAAKRPELAQTLLAEFEAVAGSSPPRPWWRFW